MVKWLYTVPMGPTVEMITNLTQAPQAGRRLSAAAGEGAQALAAAAREGGKLFRAQIPKSLLEKLERAGLVRVSTTLTSGAVAKEYCFTRQASEFINKFFVEVK